MVRMGHVSLHQRVTLLFLTIAGCCPSEVEVDPIRRRRVHISSDTCWVYSQPGCLNVAENAPDGASVPTDSWPRSW